MGFFLLMADNLVLQQRGRSFETLPEVNKEVLLKMTSLNKVQASLPEQPREDPLVKPTSFWVELEAPFLDTLEKKALNISSSERLSSKDHKKKESQNIVKMA